MKQLDPATIIITWLLLALLPSIVALSRRHHNAAAIVATNLLLGWTLIGWALAMIWSLTAVRGAHGEPEHVGTPPRRSRTRMNPGGMLLLILVLGIMVWGALRREEAVPLQLAKDHPWAASVSTGLTDPGPR